MRSCTFRSVVSQCAARLKWSPAVDQDHLDLSEAQWTEVVGYINECLRECWEYDWWPDLMLIEERTVTEHATTDVRYVAWEETGKTILGTVKNIYRENPQVTRYPYQIPFTMNPDGAVVNDLAPDEVFVMFRLRPTEFTASRYDAARTYAVGELTYYEAEKECYVCIKEATDKVPTNTTYWTQLEFPVWLRSAVVQGVYADGLDDEDQETARWKVRERMTDLLVQAADTEVMGQSGTDQARVIVV